jgi:peptide/nickel transport system substrate-binding protein
MMLYRWLKNPLVVVFTPLMLALLFAVACGGAATAIPLPAATTAPAATATPVPVARPAATPAPAAVVTPKGKRGGVIPMHLSERFPHWSVWEGATGGLLAVSTPLWNGLIQYNGETEDPNDIRGDLARSWTLSDDGLSYVFKLHENARWNDGKPVTADDVVWSLDQMVEGDPPKPRPSQIRPYYGGSRAIDKSTVEVKMKYPSAAFFSLLASDYSKILPKHHYEPGLALDKTFMRLQENILGSGPFKVKEYKKDISIEYVRNDDYFKEGLPYFDGIKAITITDVSTGIAAYKSGQLLMTLWYSSGMQVKEALELDKDMEGKGRTFSVGPLAWNSLVINTKAEPFTDVRVRRALHLALHRQAFVDTIGGGVYPIGAPFPPNAWYYKTDAEVKQLPGIRATAGGAKHPDDIAEAKRLLADAGYANGFDTTILALQALSFVEGAQIAADQLKRFLNINATVQPLEITVGITRFVAGDWKLGYIASGFQTPDPDSIIVDAYLKGGNRNYSGWESPKVTELFELQTRERDPQKRRALMLEMADYLSNVDSPIVVTHWLKLHGYVDNRIKNFHAPSLFVAHATNEHLWFEAK